MPARSFVRSNRYQDSVTLMQVAVRLRELPEIEDAALMMGTAPNKEMLHEANLLTPEGEAAGPNDLIIAVRGTDTGIADAERRVEELLKAELPASVGEGTREVPHSMAAGLNALPDANLALISTPGIYAAAEARKALLGGRHVMLFSDNVSLEDEIALKKLATARGLLMMGPDCGTAIIGGVPLGFANAVRRGSIGVVGASGTGMQEVTSLIDRYGQGVSHAIGTGSRDLSERVGGSMTLAALGALLDDPQTRTVVLVSKPPHPSTATRVEQAAAAASKPVVVCFLNTEEAEHVSSPNITRVWTLEDAARRAVTLAGGGLPGYVGPPQEEVQALAAQFRSEQRYVRGLFSGGTFCYEALGILQRAFGTVYSNVPLGEQGKLAHHAASKGHTSLDLGADEFTVGRPHPMIDLSTRAERILREAADPEVAVILLDVVLGYGAHHNPASVLAGVIGEAKKRAEAGGRTLAFVASICGTRADPQGLDAQQRTLKDIGVLVAESNAAAAWLAVGLAGRPVQSATGA